MEALGELREAPGSSGRAQEAPGRLQEAPGRLQEAPGALLEAPGDARGGGESVHAPWGGGPQTPPLLAIFKDPQPRATIQPAQHYR